MKKLQARYPFLDIKILIKIIRKTLINEGDKFSFKVNEKNDDVIFKIEFASEYIPACRYGPEEGFDNRNTIFDGIKRLEESLGAKTVCTIKEDSAVIVIPYDSYFDMTYTEY